MNGIATYSAMDSLRNGAAMEIRALRPEDREGMLSAVDRSSPQSLYRRFFGAKRHFSEKEIAFYTEVDFVNHVALVAVVEEKGRPTIVAGGRYIADESGNAEVAFVVIDGYQGQGIGATLMRHLVAIARGAGLTKLTAEVLADNSRMLKVFEKCGLRMNTTRASEVVHVVLALR